MSYTTLDMAIDALTRDLDALQKELSGIKGIEARVSDLQNECGKCAIDSDQRERIAYLRMQANTMAWNAINVSSRLRAIANTSIAVNDDFKRSIELIQGGAA